MNHDNRVVIWNDAVG